MDPLYGYICVFSLNNDCVCVNTHQDQHFDIILCVFDWWSAISSENQLNLVLRGGFMFMHLGCEHKVCGNEYNDAQYAQSHTEIQAQWPNETSEWGYVC